MWHPLAPDLADFSNDELMTKYNELNTRWIQANRSGSVSILGQMSLLLETYKYEISKRHNKMLEEASNRNPSFKNIIDIK
jgi:hypothetical protein